MRSTDRINALINPKLLQSSAYQVQEASGMVKLDAMENPFSLPDEVNVALVKRLKEQSLNRYPDPEAHSLKIALRKFWGFDADQPMLLGNGSDELIQLILISLLGQEQRTLVSVQPSFVMYRLAAEALGWNFVGVDLDEGFELNQETMVTAIEQHQPSVIFLAQPNNPTGNLFSEQALEAVIQAAPGLVVIDEAYGSFSSRDHMNYLQVNDHVMVMRTISKIGLAGLRVGALMASEEWLSQLNKARLPYNLNVMSQVVAESVLSNRQVLDGQLSQLKIERQRLLKYFSKVEQWQVFSSEANFILVRSLRREADDVFNHLLARGILIKNLHGGHPLLHQCLRITVGAPNENDALIKAFSELECE